MLETTLLKEIKWLVVDTEYTRQKHCLELCGWVLGDTEPRINRFFCPSVEDERQEQTLREYINRMKRNNPDDYFPETEPDELMEKYKDEGSFLAIVPVLLHLATTHVFVAHNYKGAELAVLAKEFRRFGLSRPKFSYACTLELAKRLVPQLQAGDIGYSQDALGELLKRPFKKGTYGVRHTAKADTKHLVVLWQELLEVATKSALGIRTLGDLQWLQCEDVGVIRSIQKEKS